MSLPVLRDIGCQWQVTTESISGLVDGHSGTETTHSLTNRPLFILNCIPYAKSHGKNVTNNMYVREIQSVVVDSE